MSIEREPAFPTLWNPFMRGQQPQHIPGMTRLEYFAGLAMQGLLATSDHQIYQATGDEIAAMSVHTAKALIAELEKQNVANSNRQG